MPTTRPRYPIYVVSKGRWNERHTSGVLHEMGVPHFVVVEEDEAEAYRGAMPASATVLVLDPAYRDTYDTCDEVVGKSTGPGPARNFAWDHATAAGHARHWVMDDNIWGFWRYHRNTKSPVTSGAALAAMEHFVERYTNVAMAGPQYYMFVVQKSRLPPFVLNTRIYSCNLIRNDLPYRWRGRYNEDTDLSLRMLKDGWCTVQFNAFLQWKQPTQTVKGGNTAEFYAKEGTLPKSEMQVKLHPDVSRLVWKFGRWHHEVDYRPFRKNRLIRKPGLDIPQEPDEFGMVYQRRVGEEWVTADG